MSYRRRRGKLSSTPSLTSIDSATDSLVKEEVLPSPSDLKDCDDQLETYQILYKAKSQELGKLSDNLKELKSQKEPLIRVKEALHEEIVKSNKLINAKSEEVTQLKHKLRHHSERQIQDNIERLEFQLRNSNYKPREEQKILDEIYMLKRSFKTLKDFELKQRENKKYRSERQRLIDQRNEVFSKMQAIVIQEDEVRKAISDFREIVNSTKRTIDHLRNLRPELEKAFYEEQRLKEEMKQKKIEEKARIRKEQYLKRQEERIKRWKEYEASREPFEEEKDLCKMLLAYLQASTPSSLNNDIIFYHGENKSTEGFQSKADVRGENKSTEVVQSKPDVRGENKSTEVVQSKPDVRGENKSTEVVQSKPDVQGENKSSESVHHKPPLPSESKSTKSAPYKTSLTAVGAGGDGVFYSKPKDEPVEVRRMSKKDKAKAKREQKAQKIKDLSHPPEVITNFDKLGIALPKKTENIPSAVLALQSKLEYFNSLGLKKDSEPSKMNEVEGNKEKAIVDTTNDKVLTNGNHIDGHSKNLSSSSDVNSLRDEYLVNDVQKNIPYTQASTNANHQFHSTSSQSNKPAILTNNSKVVSSKSFFSAPVSNIQSGSDSSAITYASVTAKIGV